MTVGTFQIQHLPVPIFLVHPQCPTTLCMARCVQLRTDCAVVDSGPSGQPEPSHQCHHARTWEMPDLLVSTRNSVRISLTHSSRRNTLVPSCVCTCMDVCVYTHTAVHTHGCAQTHRGVHTQTQLCTERHAHTQVCTHTGVQAPRHTEVCTQTQVCTHTHRGVHTQRHAHTGVHTQRCACTETHRGTCTHTHTGLHTCTEMCTHSEA